MSLSTRIRIRLSVPFDPSLFVNSTTFRGGSTNTTKSNMALFDDDIADSCRFEYPWKVWKSPTDYLVTLAIVSAFIVWMIVAFLYSMYFSYPTTRRDLKRVLWSNRSMPNLHSPNTQHNRAIPGNVRSPSHRRTVLQLPDRSEILSKLKLLEDSPKGIPSYIPISGIPEMKSEISSSTTEFEPSLPFPGGKLSTNFTGTIDI